MEEHGPELPACQWSFADDVPKQYHQSIQSSFSSSCSRASLVEGVETPHTNSPTRSLGSIVPWGSCQWIHVLSKTQTWRTRIGSVSPRLALLVLV